MDHTPPISRLPVETKVEIIRFAYNRTETTLPLVLCAISREWRALALDLPEIWTRIDSKLKPEHIPAYMARSGSKPLRICLTKVEHTPANLISTILQEMPRVQEMRLVGALLGERHRVFDSHWELEAPLLRKVLLYSFSLPRTVFSGHAPMLSELALIDCQFDWKSLPPLPQLTSLGISRPGDRISIEDFVKRLPSMPLLSSVQTVEALTGIFTNPYQFRLSNITQLQLFGEDATLVAEMLRCITLPRVKRVTLDLEAVGPQDQVALRHALDHCISFSRLSVKNLKVKARKWTCVYSIENASASVALRFRFRTTGVDGRYHWHMIRRLKLERVQLLWIDFANVGVTADFVVFWRASGRRGLVQSNRPQIQSRSTNLLEH